MVNDIRVIDKITCGRTIFEVLEYDSLEGSTDPSIASSLYYAQKTGIKLRQVKVTLLDETSEIVTEAGALHYYKGRIRAENKVGGFGGLAKKLFNNKMNGEKVFRPSYIGRGEVYLEPSFNHFVLFELNNDALIVDKGMYYASSGNVTVDVTMVNTASSALLGSDGLFQTIIKGSGIAVVELPVPYKELVQVQLEDEVLKVDGDFALMRTGNIKYSVSLGNKGILKTWASQEHLLETFQGTGSVWLAPTNDVYKDLAARLTGNNMNTGDVLRHQNREYNDLN